MNPLRRFLPPIFLLVLLTLLGVAFCGDEKLIGFGAEKFQNGNFSFEEALARLKKSSKELYNNLTTYKHIHFEGAERYSEPELKRLIAFQDEESFFHQPPNVFQEKLKKLAWIEKAEVRAKFFPLQLNVQLLEADPWLVSEQGGESWLVSREGKLLQSLKALASPRVVVETMSLPRLQGADDSLKLKAAVQQIKTLEEAGGAPWPIEKYSLLDHGELELTFSDMSMEADLELKQSEESKRPVQRAVIRVEDVPSARDCLLRLNKVAQDLEKRGEVAEKIDLTFRHQAVVSGQLPPQEPKLTPAEVAPKK